MTKSLEREIVSDDAGNFVETRKYFFKLSFTLSAGFDTFIEVNINVKRLFFDGKPKRLSL